MGLILQSPKSSLVGKWVYAKASLTWMATELLAVKVLWWPEIMIAALSAVSLEIF